jgi:hypothetical protein
MQSMKGFKNYLGRFPSLAPQWFATEFKKPKKTRKKPRGINQGQGYSRRGVRALNPLC